MKQLTRFFFVAALLVASGLGAGDAQGQRLYVSNTGKTAGASMATCQNPADPCDIGTVLGSGFTLNTTEGNTIAILVDAEGAQVEISDAVTVNNNLDFQFYTNDGNPTANEAGTLKFSGNLTIGADGVVRSAEDKVARIITSRTLSVAAGTNLPGTVTVSEPGRLVSVVQPERSSCMSFDDLTIAGRTQLDPTNCPDDTVTITNSLTVNERLQLLGSSVLSVAMTSAPSAANLGKAFVAVNGPDGSIQSFGGTLRLSVMGYGEPDFANRDGNAVYKDKTCFGVRGSGSIELDLEVMSAQYICVNVPSIGSSGTSTVHAGTVNFGSTAIDGDLVNRGAARTEFSSLTLSGDLTVDGRWVIAPGTTTKNPVLSTALTGNDIIVTPAEYETAIAAGGDLAGLLDTPIVARDSVDNANTTVIRECSAWRRPGVHLLNSSTIEGNVIINNIAQQVKPSYQSMLSAVTPGDDGTGGRDARDEAGQYAAPCQSGLFMRNAGLTTIQGSVTAQELVANGTDAASGNDIVGTLGGYVYLDNITAGSHNLVLEGDVDIRGTLTTIDMDSPAGGASLNGCSTGISSSGAGGNKLIFSGSNYQTVTFSTDHGTGEAAIDRTLNVAAISVDKSGGAVEFRTGAAGANVTYLEPLSGTLFTGSDASAGNSLLQASQVVFSQGGGTVEAFGTLPVYVGNLSTVVYAGGDHTIGAERGSAPNITILSTGVVTLPKKSSVDNLNLYAGTLLIGEELEVKNTIEIGNTGVFDLSTGKLNHSNTGTLRYTGSTTRSAGAAWAAASEQPAAVADKRNVEINQACGKADSAGSLTVELNAGYTSLGGDLTVTRGTLDLNGSTLVAQSRRAGSHNITLQKWGHVTDSMAGAACSSLGGCDEELIDAFWAAMDDVREDDSEENQAALDKALLALNSTEEAKTSGVGQGIVIGYTKRVQDAPATTHLYFNGDRDKEIPAVNLAGGHATFNGAGKTLTVPSLAVTGPSGTGGAGTEATVRQAFESVSVGDLTVTSGKIVFQTAKTSIGNHVQTGGHAEAAPLDNAEGSYAVTGDLSATGQGAVLARGPKVRLVVAGDVTLNMPHPGGFGLSSNPMGALEFRGTEATQVVSSAHSLGHVVMNASAGVTFTTNLEQPDFGTLTLQRGHILPVDTAAWVLHNRNIEEDLAERSAIPAGDAGTIILGNRGSFIAGNVTRFITEGNTGAGNPKGGYLFPVGALAETDGGRNRYRPLILNFATDVSPALKATASTYSGSVDWPASGIEIPKVGGGTTVLDTYASVMWKLEVDAIPSLGATVRVAADGLAGVNDSNGLRLIQWDCDGSNPRLAGEFDLSGSGVDAGSVSVNGRINGVPNTTMDGIDLATCNVFGLAANHAENPIGDVPQVTPMANVQLIHNVSGATVDIYVGDVLVEDDFAFQTATSLSTQIAAGRHTVHVTAANAVDNSSPLKSVEINLAENGKYTVIANGDATNFDFAVLANTRSETVADNKVEFRVVNGASSLGEVDVRSLAETGRWANNLGFNEATGYRTVDAIVHNVELLDGSDQIDVFEVDLGDYINQTLVLALSGAGTSSANGLQLMGVTTDGSVFFPKVVTSTATEELPTEFALQGNYPNPFNPSTQIQFDLPSTAEVTVQVIDLLGRMVLTLPAQNVEAGANRTVELDGSSLSSGTYLYRLIAEMESGVKIETGRMVMIK